jgi:hypothetical protein
MAQNFGLIVAVIVRLLVANRAGHLTGWYRRQSLQERIERYLRTGDDAMILPPRRLAGGEI